MLMPPCKRWLLNLTLIIYLLCKYISLTSASSYLGLYRTGGIGYKELRRFYRECFCESNPPSTKIKLVSRTIGVDRVVDEMHFKFKHTQEIPWLLPGVQPTNKDVEFMLVAVVCIRGEKLYHEHIYWDQATILAQIGLIDPKGLPIVGAEGARKALDEKSEPSNRLLKDW
jgi:hypothetical protein